MEEVRVRFAPSPTGPLHIGGARSALFNYLLARKYNGKMIVRIEDTDLERSSRESEENILEALRWLGIEWDEGIDKGGPHGPYRQSERQDLYQKYVTRLLEQGQAYYCYCTEEELAAQREELLARGEMPRYMGECRDLTPAEREKLEKEGRKPAIRFRVPENRKIIVDDLVRGEVVFESNGIGDFIIVKSDGIPTYNFAVVVDDAEMNITHVIRGEEHLSNTPRQLLLFEALGLPVPRYAHISLILGKDRSKMSKRHGATSVIQYKEKGYLPEALVNFLALLGWAPEGEEEIFDLSELIEHFSLERVAKNPAIFDLDKLNWLNGYYIRRSSVERITDLAIPFLQEKGYLPSELSSEQYEWVKRVVGALQSYLSYVGEITDYIGLFFGEEVNLEDEEARKILQEEQVPRVIEHFRKKLAEQKELTPERVKRMLKELTKELKLGGRKVFMPIRVALTGKTKGPELHDIIPILGVELIQKRLDNSIKKVHMIEGN
ncbi:glutamate--tRNA ligase [Calderihabitans maritimus]|nr:glutamate--tRNA ligase [Calderihabitans maritimus]